MVTNCQWEPCPVPGANKKKHFSFIPFLWFSDNLPQKADYFDRTRLGSGSMCSQTGRSERTGICRWCEGVHLLIQTSCTSLTMSSNSVMLLLRSRQRRQKLHSQSPLWYRGQINGQLMVSELWTWSSHCSRQADESDPLLYLALNKAKICRAILCTELVPRSIRDGKKQGEEKGLGERIERKVVPGSTVTFFYYSLVLLLRIYYFLNERGDDILNNISSWGVQVFLTAAGIGDRQTTQLSVDHVTYI